MHDASIGLYCDFKVFFVSLNCFLLLLSTKGVDDGETFLNNWESSVLLKLCWEGMTVVSIDKKKVFSP